MFVSSVLMAVPHSRCQQRRWSAVRVCGAAARGSCSTRCRTAGPRWRTSRRRSRRAVWSSWRFAK
ncbi:jg24260, partial [Pararge aegeria aegeria]